jgi:hypothetical protein
MMGVSNISPLNTPNLAAWYKADAITGKNDGDALSSWIDSSVNGYNAITSGNVITYTAPTYKTNILNGLPSVRFADGNGLVTSLLAAGLFAQPTVFAVIKPTSTVNTYSSYINIDNGNTGVKMFIDMRSSLGLQTFGYYYTFSLSSSIFLTPANTPATNNILMVTNKNDGVWITQRYYDSTNIKIKQLLTPSNGNVYTGNTAGINLGSRQTNRVSYNFVGDMYEILIYDRALTINEIELIESYLRLKWNI